jgi:energy-coupling factor transporter ATP-binding protein EcfA2
MPKASRKTTPKKDRSAEQETPAVYFRSIEVENVLCFKDKQVLDLSNEYGNPVQWTVILGDNGVGKTTLLRCLAGMEIEQDEFTNDSTDTLPLLFLEASYVIPWFETLEEMDDDDDDSVSYINGYFSFSSGLTNISQDQESFCEQGKIELTIYGATSEASCSSDQCSFKQLQCYGYGAIRNLGRTSLSETFKTDNSVSLFNEGTPLINAEEWLLQTDYARRSSEGKIHDRLSSQLLQIIDILKIILPDIDDIRIRLVEDDDIPRSKAEFKTKYGWVHIDGLGLGYRTAIAWMVDLAVRMFRRYPNSADPLSEPAIVLVDEIDLHLHPRWQRTIMSFLSDRFPNTQFIVTAHSPLVVQAAKDANIVLLRREGDRVIIDNNPAIIENWRVDQVLSSVFELESDRPPHLDPLIKRRREILSQPHLSKADEKELKSLDAKIGPLPTATDPEDIKAMDIIRRAAHLLESI